MAPWAPFALTGITAALLALPVTPALYELWKRRDAGPLPISRHDGNIAGFAEVFRSRLAPLRLQLELCRAARELSRTRVDGIEVLLVGGEDFDFDPRLTEGVAAVMCARDALVPAGRVVEADVYANSSLILGEGATLRAARAAGDVILEKDSAVLRWLHADGSIYLRQGSSAYGRLSAGQSVRLEQGCEFQHLSAPQILTGQTEADVDQCATDPGDGFASSCPRIRIKGNFVLPAGETLRANVIATGELHFAPGARLLGSAKSYGDTVLDEDAGVQGSIVCGGTVQLGPRSFIGGPVLAEDDVVIARGTRVGGPNALTTVSSRGARIAGGCQLHGTVWARARGSVEG